MTDASQEECCVCGTERTKVIDGLNCIKTWMGEDSDNLVFRRFEDLSVRNLLYLQHELADLERKMEEFDNLKRVPREVEGLDELMVQARSLLTSYHKAFFDYQHMKNMPHTPAYTLRVLENSDVSAAKAFRSEHDGRDGLADLSSIVTTAKGVVHRYIDSNWRLTSLLARIENPKHKSATYNYSENVLWYIDQFVMNCCVVALVGIPIAVLTFVPTMIGKLFVVLGFVVIAAPLTSSKYLASSNMPLMLAYAAILVAFLGQTSDSSPHT